MLKHPIKEAKLDRKVAEGKAAFAASTSPPSLAGTRVMGHLQLDDEEKEDSSSVRGKLTTRFGDDEEKGSASKKQKVF